MNKLLGLFLLALAFLAPVSADAANRFWVGGTGTWDSTATTNWAATSGGASGVSAPTTGDVVTFDAASGGGVVTVDSTINGLSLVNFNSGAFTGTLDLSVNNPSITITGSMLLGGTGARKFLLGSGTFTFTSNGPGTLFDLGNVTNLDPTSDTTANFTFTATTANPRTFSGGGRTYGVLTISANTSRGTVSINGANTFSSISLAAGTTLILPAAATTTVSNALTLAGTSSNPISLLQVNTSSSAATISIASGTTTLDWGALLLTTVTGGGTFNATNTLDLGRNTNWSITPPSGGGGGGGGRIIGG